MMQPLRCELVRLALPIKEEDLMEKFLSPSTRLELQRFRNWEEWFAEVAEGTDDREVGATDQRIALTWYSVWHGPILSPPRRHRNDGVAGRAREITPR
jgi:hypothetical protein